MAVWFGTVCRMDAAAEPTGTYSRRVPSHTASLQPAQKQILFTRPSYS